MKDGLMVSSAFIALGSNLNLEGFSSHELLKAAIGEFGKSKLELQAMI